MLCNALPPRKIQANLLILLFLSLSQNALSEDTIELEAMHIVAEPENYFIEEANTFSRRDYVQAMFPLQKPNQSAKFDNRSQRELHAIARHLNE